MSAHPEEQRPRNRAWACGAAVQGLVLGLLLVAALVGLLIRDPDALIFRYQRF